MTSGNGVVAAKALEVLACQDYDRNAVAAALGVHRRTVGRWERGDHQPNRKNRTGLRALVGELILAAYCARETPQVKARLKRLNDAALALMTADEKAAAKAERDEIAHRLRADMEAAEQRRREAEQARLSEARALVAQHKQERRDRLAAGLNAIATWKARTPAFADVAPSQPRSVIYQLADPWDALPAEPAPLPF